MTDLVTITGKEVRYFDPGDGVGRCNGIVVARVSESPEVSITVKDLSPSVGDCTECRLRKICPSSAVSKEGTP